jgi:hypothetical protein
VEKVHRTQRERPGRRERSGRQARPAARFARRFDSHRAKSGSNDEHNET